MSVTFEFPEYPNGFSITNDQFASIHKIVALDWSRNYEVSGAPNSFHIEDAFMLVEKKEDGDQGTEAIYRVEPDGDYGLLWERKRTDAEMIVDKVRKLLKELERTDRSGDYWMRAQLRDILDA